jgi:hypothetical protein
MALIRNQNVTNRLIVEAILEQQKNGQINPIKLKNLATSVNLFWCAQCEDFFSIEHQCFKEE